MTRVKMEDIVDHLSSEIRRALADAVNRTDSTVHIDEHQLFREFKRAIGRKCNTWEQVPDRFVDAG
jgi:hypothetical protein